MASKIIRKVGDIFASVKGYGCNVFLDGLKMSYEEARDIEIYTIHYMLYTTETVIELT